MGQTRTVWRSRSFRKTVPLRNKSRAWCQGQLTRNARASRRLLNNKGLQASLTRISGPVGKQKHGQQSTPEKPCRPRLVLLGIVRAVRWGCTGPLKAHESRQPAGSLSTRKQRIAAAEVQVPSRLRRSPMTRCTGKRRPAKLGSQRRRGVRDGELSETRRHHRPMRRRTGANSLANRVLLNKAAYKRATLGL